MPGARLSLEEREEIALGIVSGRSLTRIARGSAVRSRGSRGRSPGMGTMAVTGRWSRSGRHAVARAGRGTVVSQSIGSSLGRLSGDRGCGTHLT